MGMLEVTLAPDGMGCGNVGGQVASDRMGCGNVGGGTGMIGCGNVGGGSGAGT